MSVELERTAVPAGALPPIVKEVIVALEPRRAFELFTTRVADWWPLAMHSVAGADAVACAFEERVGGRLYETARDGSQHTWGTVLEWDPPAGLVMTWHAGRDVSAAQRLAISFAAVDGGTRVRLVHTGWEALGDAADSERASYDSGWDYVLGLFTAGAES